MTEPRVALVTGGTSGIGRSLVWALARDRWRIAIAGRRQDALDHVERVARSFGGDPLAVRMDVQSPGEVSDGIERTLAAWGRIDLALLSAGIALRMKPQEFRSQVVSDTLDINVIGVAHCMEALHRPMGAQEGGGTIAVISSLAADRALAGTGAAYSASKAAISQLCDGLRAAWAEEGVRLVTVSPGFIRTPMTAENGYMPLLMEPEDAAGAIIDGIRRGRSIIRFPQGASLAMGALRFLPAAAIDFIYRMDRQAERRSAARPASPEER